MSGKTTSQGALLNQGAWGVKNSARIYRPAFSWKQAQNACIHLIENERFGWFSRKQGL
jgi:hypothetical protein